MAGRHPNARRPRDESAHPLVQHALDNGYLSTGKPYVVPGFTSYSAANDGRNAIYNAARHLGVACSSRKAEDIHSAPDGTWSVHFKLYTKNEGRQYIRASTGGDPAKLAYNPFQRAAPRVLDDDGRTLQ